MGDPADEGGRMADEMVPITDVVLFSSGVGYFSRSGKVSGSAKLELTFNTDQINDLLKSMVVLDLDGGHVSTVSYASHDPANKALQAFGVDLAGNPSLANLLVQLRGVHVRVSSAAEQNEGTVLAVETRSKKTENGDTIAYEVLDLLTAEGILQFPIADLTDIRVLDDNLREDMHKALAVLAKSRDRQKRSVTISFDGEGQRRVNVAYILEAPVWKTSYRLVLSDKPLLQGWAIVDNTTDSDWSSVNLSLVAGRPISFIQDLDTPLYLPRPVVKPQLYAGLRPVLHEEAMEGAEMDKAEWEAPMMEMAAASMAPPPSPSAKKMRSAPARAVADMLMDDEMLKSSAEPTASGKDVGELFLYTVGAPVTVGRQSSAMIPIIAENVEAKKLSIFNSGNHPTHPYSAFKMKNTSALSLLAGPITVFDEGIYAGDAQMANLQAGEERILSYGLDLACTVEVKGSDLPSTLSSVKISRGVAEIMYRQRVKTEYLAKNKKDAKKTVLIEHPCSYNWDLKAPEDFEERTDDYYRFKLEVEPNATAALEVLTESMQMSQVYLTDVDISQLSYFISHEETPAKVRKVLENIRSLKQELDDVSTRLSDLEERKDQLFSDQKQIRDNLSSVPKNSKLYTRYLGKLESQEDEIDRIEGELDELRDKEQAKQKELDDYIASIEIE
jgi:hypothetical protein